FAALEQEGIARRPEHVHANVLDEIERASAGFKVSQIAGRLAAQLQVLKGLGDCFRAGVIITESKEFGYAFERLGSGRQPVRKGFLKLGNSLLFRLLDLLNLRLGEVFSPAKPHRAEVEVIVENVTRLIESREVVLVFVGGHYHVETSLAFGLS